MKCSSWMKMVAVHGFYCMLFKTTPYVTVCSLNFHSLLFVLNPPSSISTLDFYLVVPCQCMQTPPKTGDHQQQSVSICPCPCLPSLYHVMYAWCVSALFFWHSCIQVVISVNVIPPSSCCCQCLLLYFMLLTRTSLLMSRALLKLDFFSPMRALPGPLEIWWE